VKNFHYGVRIPVSELVLLYNCVFPIIVMMNVFTVFLWLYRLNLEWEK